MREATRQHGLTMAGMEGWYKQFLLTEHRLRRHPKNKEVLKEERINKLKLKIGYLVVENDVLRVRDAASQ
ncbi:hypothetical protein [Candidatus Nitrospira salsa]